jgi:predicted transglutaminase-like cysteine proteinase
MVYPRISPLGRVRRLVIAALGLVPVAALASGSLHVGKAVASELSSVSNLLAGQTRLHEWRVLLHGLQEKDPTEQLRMVNDFFNATVRYESDVRTWGVEDYWATPEELLIEGRGDCEDIAIAKYVSLRALGMVEATLRLAYVMQRSPGTPDAVRAHIVLTHDPSGEWRMPSGRWVLDNLTSTVVHSSMRKDLQEVLLFNRINIIVSQTGQLFESRKFLRWARFLERLDATSQTPLR